MDMEVVFETQESEAGMCVRLEVEKKRIVGARTQDEAMKALMIRTEAVESSAVCSSGEDTTNDDHAGGDDDSGFTPEVVACQAVVCGQSCSPRRIRCHCELCKALSPPTGTKHGTSRHDHCDQCSSLAILLPSTSYHVLRHAPQA